MPLEKLNQNRANASSSFVPVRRTKVLRVSNARCRRGCGFCSSVMKGDLSVSAYGQNRLDGGDVLSSHDLVVGGYCCKIPRQEFSDAADRMVGSSSCGLRAVLAPSRFFQGTC